MQTVLEEIQSFGVRRQSPNFTGKSIRIHKLIAQRSSPYLFNGSAIEESDLVALFEAARWSASAGNEQPWSYIVATRNELSEFERMLSCISEANRSWAKLAAVLVVACARTTLERTGELYLTAEHDLGLASANLVFEASARGLGVHQMTYIDRNRIRELYQVPNEVKIVDALAIGYSAEECTSGRSVRQRARKPLTSFVFAGMWSQTSRLVVDAKASEEVEA